MKKLFGIVSVLVLSFSILAGCGSNKNNTGTPAATDMPATTPAATDMPATTPAAAAPDADPTPAGTDTETDTEEITITSAIDLTAYPVMWYQEYPFNAEAYDSLFYSTSASKIYEKDDVIGTNFVGFRLIDDTHIEEFSHIKLNDDIDASLLLSSLDEEVFNKRDMIRISDWETDMTTLTLTYEIDGANIFISDGQNIYENYSVSPDFTSFFRGKSEFTYHADF